MYGQSNEVPKEASATELSTTAMVVRRDIDDDMVNDAGCSYVSFWACGDGDEKESLAASG
jgi:hypothetical protein